MIVRLLFAVSLSLATYSQTYLGSSRHFGDISFGVRQVMMPLEIMTGANGVAADSPAVPITIPVLLTPAAATTLTLKVHNLRDKTLSDSNNGSARVNINGGSWVNIKDSAITLASPDFGGVGGAANTITFTIPVAGSTLVAGANSIRFGHRGTDGFASAYRVLSISIKTLGGAELIRAGTFVDEDPSVWTAPYVDGTNITAGQTLWNSQTLSFPFTGTTGIAHCNDCHASGASDLKYFNYSNRTIINRAQFHGLTEEQGKQIASYVRSRSVTYTPYARPWNPPYQPGPGIDARGAYHWAAGAGLDAVVTDSVAMAAIVPNNGGSTDFNFVDKTLNVRQTPITFHLPDWNQWLPRIHPVDAHGRSTFESNPYYTYYTTIRAAWAPGTLAALQSTTDTISSWDVARYNYMMSTYPPPGTYSFTSVTERYGAQLWQIVKLWEMHHEFNMEPKSQGYYRPSAEIWAWYSTRIFQASARLNQIPPHDEDPNVTGILNDSWKSYVFFGHSWYWLQAVLHAGNGSQADNNPMDWPYIDGTVIDISTAGPGGHRIPSMQLLNYVVGMQVLYQNTSNTNAYFSGFPFTMVNSGSWRGLWNQTNNTQRTTIWNNVLNKWLDKWNDFTPSELYAIGVATAGQSVQADPGGMGYKIWTNIPRFRHTGVSQSIINALCDFADTVWTNAGDNWNALKTAPCTTEDDDIACTYP